MGTNEKPVKLSAKLPKQAPRNGLDTIHQQMIKSGGGYIIARVSAPEVVHRAGGAIRQPNLVIEHVEGLPEGELGRAAGQLLAWARAEREGDGDGAMISRDEFLATVRGQADDQAD